VLLIGGLAVITAAGLAGGDLVWWALGVSVGINLLDAGVAWAGLLLHAWRRQRLPDPVDSEAKSGSQVPIPDSVRHRSRDVKRRLGGETLAATDRRTLLDEERKRRGL